MTIQALPVRDPAPFLDPAELHTPASENRLRLLSYNVCVGICTEKYQHYLTRAWQHVLPSPYKRRNLDRISELVRHFDLVALQEVDGGSLRTGFVNQIKYLAERSGMPYWYQQRNRNLGPLAQHSNGMLCRNRPHFISDHTLPGRIPGRGAIEMHLGNRNNPLVILMMHLALGKRDQHNQLAYIRDLVQSHQNLVLMGDLNMSAERLIEDSPLKHTNLHLLADTKTYPSWKPHVGLDHILVSGPVQVHRSGVVDHQVSDHLPVAMDIEIPDFTIQ